MISADMVAVNALSRLVLFLIVLALAGLAAGGILYLETRALADSGHAGPLPNGEVPCAYCAADYIPCADGCAASPQPALCIYSCNDAKERCFGDCRNLIAP